MPPDRQLSGAEGLDRFGGGDVVARLEGGEELVVFVVGLFEGQPDVFEGGPHRRQ